MSDQITKQAKRLSLLHPLNIYPPSIGGIVLLFNTVEYSLLTSLVGGGLVAAGALSILYNRFININEFHQLASEREHQKRVKEMQQQFDQMFAKFSINKRVDAMEQVQQLTQKIWVFNNILEQRFKHGGLAYCRFMGISDSISSNALKVYEEILLILKQANTINERNCASQIRSLQRSDGNESKIRELKTRIDVKRELLERVDAMLLGIDKAITKLDLTMTSFKDITTENEINWALEELESLSKALTNNNNGETLR